MAIVVLSTDLRINALNNGTIRIQLEAYCVAYTRTQCQRRDNEWRSGSMARLLSSSVENPNPRLVVSQRIVLIRPDAPRREIANIVHPGFTVGHGPCEPNCTNRMMLIGPTSTQYAVVEEPSDRNQGSVYSILSRKWIT
jgi:hypothetical protein